MNNTPNNYSRSAKDLLLKLLFKRATEEEVASCDPQEMATLAIFSRSEAHVLWRLGQLFPPARPAPPSSQKLATYLQARCLQNAARNLKHDQVAREVCASLLKEGLEVMLLKGTAIRARYPDLAGRPQSDTDLMVRSHEVERAEQLMKKLGYRVDEKEFTREEYLTQHFDLRMIREGIPVEIHWSMSNQCVDGGVDRSWQRAEKVLWRGLELYLPGIEDETVFTLIHICRHHFFLSLKWFGDLLVALEHHPDLVDQAVIAAGDWPSRMVDAPLSVAVSLGMRDNSRANHIGGLDGLVLKSVVKAAAFNDSLLGMPPYYLGGGLTNWVSKEEGHLVVDLVSSAGKKVMQHRIFHS